MTQQQCSDRDLPCTEHPLLPSTGGPCSTSCGPWGPEVGVVTPLPVRTRKQVQVQHLPAGRARPPAVWVSGLASLLCPPSATHWGLASHAAGTTGSREAQAAGSSAFLDGRSDGAPCWPTSLLEGVCPAQGEAFYVAV